MDFSRSLCPWFNMSNSFEISLIIPAYNAEDYLEEAIRSALTQSMPAREIIVVDDGSTDRTADIAVSFGTEVQLIRQCNLGVSAARNVGIRSAKSPWIAFLDADDVMVPDRFEIQGQMLAENPKLEIISGLQVLFEGRQWLPGITREPFGPGLASAITCRTTAFAKVGLFDTRYRGPEVIAWLTKAADLKIPSAVANRPVVYRRVHDRNLSRTMRPTDEYARMIKDLLDRRRSV